MVCVETNPKLNDGKKTKTTHTDLVRILNLTFKSIKLKSMKAIIL